MSHAKRFHVVVLDLSLNAREGVQSGLQLLARLLAQDSCCRVIVLTGHASKEHGIECLRRGAAHFLEKPADIPHLVELVRDGISQSQLRRELEELRKESLLHDSELIVGKSDCMLKVRESIAYAAETTQAILITGETGTGKGLCAHAIHHQGRRRDNRFVRYQPNYSSADLVNSDLFGHLRGAFTGALEERKGLFSEAHKGTLFLDEIDELPIESQVTLLGVLQEKKFRPLGSNRELEVDTRFLSATNRKVDECVASGKLRTDLYHRIAHFIIALPPLRDRREDISLLARAFLERIQIREQVQVFDIEASAMEKLVAYHWPGNVRQLEAVIEGAIFLAQFRKLSTVSCHEINLGQESNVKVGEGFHERVESYKLALIKEALENHNGNQVKAAEALGLDRSTMRRLLERTEG